MPSYFDPFIVKLLDKYRQKTLQFLGKVIF